MSETDLSKIFSSQAKVALLETLYRHVDGLSLRQLSEVSGVQIRSAQLALDNLQKQRIVKVRRFMNRRIVLPRMEEPIWELLNAIFRERERFLIRESARKQKNATVILSFINSGRKLVAAAKRTKSES